VIIILNGPINSGKTTVAKILWEKIPNTAHIEIDKIREFIDWMENKPSWEISFSTALSVAKEFLKNNLNVIITYHISNKGYQQIKECLEPIDKDVFAFTFLPPLNKTLTNRGARELNMWEIKRIKETYEKENHKVTFGETIDNSSQTPQETAEYIFNKVKNSIKKTNIYPRRDKLSYS
jgi:guanylate kinase